MDPDDAGEIAKCLQNTVKWNEFGIKTTDAVHQHENGDFWRCYLEGTATLHSLSVVVHIAGCILLVYYSLNRICCP
jgi:hypothetical protein